MRQYAVSEPNRNRKGHGHNASGHRAQSEMRHDRLHRSNPRRDIVAAPYSLQKISRQLPRRPSMAYQGRGQGMFPFFVKTNSAPIHFRGDTMTKYDIEFNPPLAEDARDQRRDAFDRIRFQIEMVYGLYYVVYIAICICTMSFIVFRTIRR